MELGFKWRGKQYPVNPTRELRITVIRIKHIKAQIFILEWCEGSPFCNFFDTFLDKKNIILKTRDKIRHKIKTHRLGYRPMEQKHKHAKKETLPFKC